VSETPSGRLLVGSVYADCGPAQVEWLRLQRSFLEATTTDYDLVVVVNDTVINPPFGSEVAVVRAISRKDPSQAHVGGLIDLVECFRRRQDRYTHFLIIDNDAFPIRKGWFADLVGCMKDREIAIAIRSENLEQRLHASILLAKKEALGNLEFVLSEGTSLLGDVEKDIMPVKYAGEQLRRVFPLMRSNRRNVHPTRCGVYYDMFYHHGCGTPNHGQKHERWMRGDLYWNGIVPSGVNDCAGFRDRLFNDPEGFVAYLAGWSPTKYPEGKKTPEFGLAWAWDGISFRKVGEDDLETLMRLKMEVWENNHSLTFLNMRDQMKWLEGLKTTNPDNLVLVAIESGEKFGILKVLGIDWVSRSASIGWDVLDGHRGKGKGKRLVEAGVRFCTDVLGLGSLDAEVVGSNKASHKCALAAGFREVGVRQGRLWKNGEYEDSVIYEFVRSGR
jgi:RimJ/RimL family protein N-acetyltransferase